MNPYLTHLSKLEFVVTDACTGQCLHCSQGDHPKQGTAISASVAAEAVCAVAANYALKTVMTFGGEPLLFPEVVAAIHEAATKAAVPKRQVITNGFFSRNSTQIASVAKLLADCGVNEVLVSVDAFHQRTIPLEPVREFVGALQRNGVPLKLQPAWLVNPLHDNPYNRETRALLAQFSNVPVGEGNCIFPEGNARHFLNEYFSGDCPENPYVEDERDIRCLSFECNGNVLGGNVYKQNILDIIRNYAP